jgi:hypothetical protein
MTSNLTISPEGEEVSDNNLLCVDGQSDVDEDGSTCDNSFWDDSIDSGDEQDLGDINTDASSITDDSTDDNQRLAAPVNPIPTHTLAINVLNPVHYDNIFPVSLHGSFWKIIDRPHTDWHSSVLLEH